MSGGKQHKLIKVTSQFFIDHSYLLEIENKENRPYNMCLFEIQGNIIAIPFRSNINHPHAILTDKKNKCGLDLSKVIIIDDVKYISNDMVKLRKNEFKEYNRKKYLIEPKFIKYLEEYKKALRKINDPIKMKLVKYSTLQNYHKQFGIK